MRSIEAKVRRAVEQCALVFAPTYEWAQQWLGGERDASAAAVAANVALAAAKRAYHFDAAREIASRACALYASEARMYADRAVGGAR